MTVERAVVTVTVTGTQVPDAAPPLAAPEADARPAAPEPATFFSPSAGLAPEFAEAEADEEAAMTVIYLVDVEVPVMVVVGPVSAAPSAPEPAGLVA